MYRLGLFFVRRLFAWWFLWSPSFFCFDGGKKTFCSCDYSQRHHLHIYFWGVQSLAPFIITCTSLLPCFILLLKPFQLLLLSSIFFSLLLCFVPDLLTLSSLYLIEIPLYPLVVETFIIFQILQVAWFQLLHVYVCEMGFCCACWLSLFIQFGSTQVVFQGLVNT